MQFSSNDPLAPVPVSSATLTNGSGTFLVTLATATRNTAWTITASDVAAGKTNSSGSINVSAAAANHFSVAVPSPATAITGTAFNVTVTALDPFGNIATGYAGTVHFSSSDSQAVLPANTTLASGMSTFSVTLRTAGNQTVTVADASATNPAVIGNGSPITVRGLVVTSFMPTPTGFTVTFNKPLVPADLTLYDANLTTPDDVTLVGATVGAIQGSLLVDSSNQAVTFSASSSYLKYLNTTHGSNNSAVLPDDVYTATLISGSGSNAFLDALGAGLDGMNSGGHANYVKAYTTSFQNDTTPVLGVPDFSRGPGGFAITNATWAANVATIYTSIASNFQVGDQIVVTGVTNSAYNSAANTTFAITGVTNSGGTHTLTYALTGTSIASSSGGDVYDLIKVPYPSAFKITSASESGSTVTIATANANNYQVGDSVVISAVSISSYNGTFSIASVTNSGGTHTFTYANPSHTGLSTTTSGGLTYKAIQVANGIPITLYNAASVTDVTFSLNYNSSLLSINDTLSGSSSDATDSSASLTLVSDTGGVATFHYSASSPTSATSSCAPGLGRHRRVCTGQRRRQLQGR